MHRSELDLTAHVPLDGADERDAERYTTTRLVRFVRKNQIYAATPNAAKTIQRHKPHAHVSRARSSQLRVRKQPKDKKCAA